MIELKIFHKTSTIDVYKHCSFLLDKFKYRTNFIYSFVKDQILFRRKGEGCWGWGKRGTWTHQLWRPLGLVGISPRVPPSLWLSDRHPGLSSCPLPPLKSSERRTGPHWAPSQTHHLSPTVVHQQKNLYITLVFPKMEFIHKIIIILLHLS